MNRNTLVRALESRLSRMILALCLIQPVMDVVSYWMDRAGLNNTVTLLLRLCILLWIVGTGFCLARRKWVYFLVVGVLLVLTAGHVAVCLHYGYQDPVSDLTNLIRIYQLPLTTLAFVTYLRRDPGCLSAVKDGFLGSLLLVILVELLATLTGTDPHTYSGKGVGVLGWFLTPNAQSAILGMLIPVSIARVMERKKFHPGWTAGAGVVGLGVLYLFATRLSYGALLGCAFGLAVTCLLVKLVGKQPAGRSAVVMALLGVAAVALVSLSPMAANTAMSDEVAQMRQQDIRDLVAADTAAAEEAGLTGQELRLASLKSVYEKYIPGPTGRFGLERTAEFYGYSVELDQVVPTRLEKRAFCSLLLEEQPACRIFGLELGDLSYDGLTYDAENDFHGIQYLCGWAGLAVLLLFLGWFAVRIIVALCRDFQHYFTLQLAGTGIALICGAAHAYFTAGVLRRPNANFYLAVLLAAAYVMTAAKGEKENEVKR